MGEEAIPEWAMEKARKLRDEAHERGEPTLTGVFARYIASHEEPPVDPLLIEARRLASETCRRAGSAYHAEQVAAGQLDNEESAGVPIALAALRRGVEIGREGC